MRLVARGLRITILAAAAVLAVGVADAAAQLVLPWTDKGFANINFGSQTIARRQTNEGNFPIYDEIATWDTSFGVGNNTLVDISGGMRLWRNLGVGVGFSRYKDTSSAPVNASIPDTLIFDSPHASSTTVDGLNHEERGIHLSAVFVIPIIDKLDLSITAGPSFYPLKKDVVSDITVANGGTTIASVLKSSLSENATGGHVGFDVRYRIYKWIGAGIFARYSTASINTNAVGEGKIEIGGLNYGGGLRIVF